MNKEQEYKYIFSIIIAVYNCEPFLKETLDSIIRQNISNFCRYKNGKATGELVPFEEIVQVITVDDGSYDGSGEICDEYSAKYKNFITIHKTNGGVASARNEGLRYAEGKYLNFLDSDDIFSDNVLYEMYRFFEEHFEETDVITMPLEFFDGASGEHWQNYKFGKRPRVANLYNEYDCPLMFVNASFFKAEYRDRVSFCGKLVCGEDIRYISEILSHKMTLGLVPLCRYYYRRRSSGEESLIQSSKKKIGWYFDYFTYLVDWAVDFCNKKWGYIPAYYQNILVCDIKWRFLNDYDKTANELLGEYGFKRYKDVLANSLRHFDDEFIISQRGIWIEHKYMMLFKKYGRHADLCIYRDDARLRFENTLFCWLSGCYTLIEFISIKNSTLVIEGYSTLLGCSDEDEISVKLFIRFGDDKTKYIPCESATCRSDIINYRLGEVIYPAFPFKATIPLNTVDKAHIDLVCFFKGNKILKKDIRFGKFSPIGKEFKHSFYAKDGYAVSFAEHTLTVKRISPREEKKLSKSFLKELQSSCKYKNGYYGIKLARLLSLFKRKQLWLILDSPSRADDNGEALFGYLCKARPKNVIFYFALNENSPDFERLRKTGRVIPYGTKKYKLAYLLADRIISSHADDFIINPFEKNFAPYRNYISDKKFVFLQHGVIKDDISRWFNKYRVNLSGFVTSASVERKSVLDGDYGYTEREVWLTGLPRFDLLYNAPEKIVTVMPTWRAYLLSGNGYGAIDDDRFKSSDYFKFYDALFSDRRLRMALYDNGYEMFLKPHPRMLPYLELFEGNANFKIYPEKISYRDIFAKSSLLITDYSSATFDFAYLGKPIIYAQFDKDKFFSGEHSYTKGYFDYERDGFGEVTSDIGKTVDTIIGYIKNGCKPKDEYKARADKFFTAKDKNNCKRVFDKILKIED